MLAEWKCLCLQGTAGESKAGQRAFQQNVDALIQRTVKALIERSDTITYPRYGRVSSISRQVQIKHRAFPKIVTKRQKLQAVRQSGSQAFIFVLRVQADGDSVSISESHRPRIQLFSSGPEAPGSMRSSMASCHSEYRQYSSDIALAF